MQFSTEQELFDTALKSAYFESLMSSSIFLVEPQGLFGIPDLVVAQLLHSNGTAKIKQSFAFEMKISNWQRALIQAFRYKAFAHLSYVVMDHHFVNRAVKSLDRFRTANIGLLSVDKNSKVVIHHQPKPDEPYSYQMEYTFGEMVHSTPQISCQSYHSSPTTRLRPNITFEFDNLASANYLIGSFSSDTNVSCNAAKNI